MKKCTRKDRLITSLTTLAEISFDFFLNIYNLLQILTTLPVTTTTAERSFLTLRKFKTYLMNNMGLQMNNIDFCAFNNICNGIFNIVIKVYYVLRVYKVIH